MTTYTKRTNAKRAAIKAGVPEDQVEITVHKSKDGVRFGWKQRDTQLLADVFPATAKQDAPVKTTVVKQSRPEQNGIKMPSPGTKCRAVWDWCEAFKKDTGNAPDAAAVREHAEKVGANINNSLIETANWKRYMGLTQSRKEASKKKAA